MKILLDSHSTVSQNSSGGLQVRIKDHLEALQRNGIEVKTFDKWSDKIEDFDIFHLFKVTSNSYNEILYAKQKGKKVVISAVMPIANRRKIALSLILGKAFKMSLPYCIIKKVFLLSDAITTESNIEKSFLVKEFKLDERKIFVIPNAVSDIFLKEQPDSKVSFKEHFKIKSPFIIQVGRIDRNKNQLNVIKALKNTGLPIAFIGGPDINDLDYYNECVDSLGPNMIMTGWIAHNSDLLISAYRDAKLLILPSFFETFGNVIIEAGVSGANIVCSNNLPITEYPVKKYFSTFDPASINSIKDAVLKEYNKSNNLQMKEEFVRLFCWDQIIRRYIDIYKSLK